ncbi:hypothetical protein AGMMS4957_03380 [Bacteroidia bacterium]|nr:hypothetical protein AGMMS4957_03380 [Bacteroidia bacterium]
MKVVRNSIIPFKGFSAINICGVLFAQPTARISDTTICHESIHTAQMQELGYALFYVLYFAEWLVRLFQYRFTHAAYRNISFEREAYSHEKEPQYLGARKRWAWVQYVIV